MRSVFGMGSALFKSCMKNIKRLLQAGVFALALAGLNHVQAGTQCHTTKAGTQCRTTKVINGDVSTFVQTSKGPRLIAVARDNSDSNRYAYDRTDRRYYQRKTWDRSDTNWDVNRNDSDSSWQSPKRNSNERS
jgi:hypothetical protein